VVGPTRHSLLSLIFLFFFFYFLLWIHSLNFKVDLNNFLIFENLLKLFKIILSLCWVWKLFFMCMSTFLYWILLGILVKHLNRDDFNSHSFEN
jgi:hypothetical protein